MATDFAVALRRFLTSYLAGLRGCSPNTIASYRDAFKLLIAWFRDERSVPPGKLTLDHIDASAVTFGPGVLAESGALAASLGVKRVAEIGRASWKECLE